jgi:nicotinamide riboside transporter PnuC
VRGGDRLSRCQLAYRAQTARLLVLWMLGNALYAIFLWQVQLYPFFASQFLFFGLSLWGLYSWRAQDRVSTVEPVTAG